MQEEERQQEDARQEPAVLAADSDSCRVRFPFIVQTQPPSRELTETAGAPVAPLAAALPCAAAAAGGEGSDGGGGGVGGGGEDGEGGGDDEEGGSSGGGGANDGAESSESSEWVCTVCTLRNSQDRAQCEACGAPAPQQCADDEEYARRLQEEWNMQQGEQPADAPPACGPESSRKVQGRFREGSGGAGAGPESSQRSSQQAGSSGPGTARSRLT